MACLVSVVIPCYDQAPFLAEAVKSALFQDCPSKEVIVINDGSPDNTDEVALAFGDHVVYLKQENRGTSAARNAGIRAASGRYIAFLDGDDVYLPETLSTQVRLLESRPDVGLVCGDAEVFDDGGVLGLRSNRSRCPKTAENIRWELVDYYPLPSTVMVRRECFDKVGPFDEQLVSGSEDWHMWVRMSLHYDMVYVDRPLARWRIHPRNASRHVERMKMGSRYAVSDIVDASYFDNYPAHFRAKLLCFRFASSWYHESKAVSLAHLWRAVCTDPTQVLYGLRVIARGITNILLPTWVTAK